MALHLGYFPSIPNNMSLTSNQIKLSIQLQPEFGWAIKDEPSFGPGSVIQGRVEMQILDTTILAQADRLRLVFHSSERCRESGSNRALHTKQFFGTQRTVWEKNKDGDLVLNKNYSFSFTLQLPLVQFPPSMDHQLYRCFFMFSAYLDPSSGNSNRRPEALATVHKDVSYMPFLETCLYKTPLLLPVPGTNGVTVSTHALDYVPSDTILMDITLPSSSCTYAAVTTELYQIVKSLDQSSQQLVTSRQQPIITPSTSSSSSSLTKMQLALPLSCDTIPSFSYGDVASVQYKLVIRLKEKKKSFLSSSSSASLELPIHIGTLGYGIRASEELKVYSVFKTAFDPDTDARPTTPIPKFLQDVEYEEALPLYEEVRLPSYDAASLGGLNSKTCSI